MDDFDNYFDRLSEQLKDYFNLHHVEIYNFINLETNKNDKVAVVFEFNEKTFEILYLKNIYTIKSFKRQFRNKLLNDKILIRRLKLYRLFK